ncbi:MAG: hypothetical protein ACRENG_05260 [bacterium]
MFPKFVAASTKLLLAAGWLAVMTTSLCLPLFAMAQEEPETESPAPETKPQDEPKLPVEVKLKRLIFKYETEVSFLLPEGEFDAAFEKKIGHFATQTRARYNFLRGEMGFSLQNAYTRFSVVPQTQVYDRLLFVPLFEEEKRKDRVWRREQGVQLGARMFFIQPINVLTSFNYQRYSFPSTINKQNLDTQQVHSVGQSLGVQADSSRAFGFYHSGLFEVEIVRAFPFGRNRSDFWQLQMATRGISESAWLSVIGEARLISLIDGQGVPLSFLGGRNRLSAYDVNEFSGINLFYMSQANRFHLNKRKPLSLVSGFSMHETNLVLHTEVGQIGLDAKVRDLSAYHVSAGLGFNGIAAYRQRRAFELFFFVYQALGTGRKPKYYFGIKY